MVSHAPLEAETRAYIALRDWLAKQHQLEPDDPFIAGTLEGETNFHELIGELAREARRREAMADAILRIVNENRLRKERHDRAVQSIRTAIACAMTEAGVKKIEVPDATISVRIGPPGVFVSEEKMLPEWAWRIKREPDMAKIKEHNKTEVIPGVITTNGKPILTIRNT